MSRRTIWWIAAVAVLAHVAFFLAFGRTNLLPKTRPEAAPNFGYKQTTFVDQQTGERTVEREIRVTTRLAEPGTYEARPRVVDAPPLQPK